MPCRIGAIGRFSTRRRVISDMANAGNRTTNVSVPTITTNKVADKDSTKPNLDEICLEESDGSMAGLNASSVNSMSPVSVAILSASAIQYFHPWRGLLINDWPAFITGYPFSVSTAQRSQVSGVYDAPRECGNLLARSIRHKGTLHPLLQGGVRQQFDDDLDTKRLNWRKSGQKCVKRAICPPEMQNAAIAGNLIAIKKFRLAPGSFSRFVFQWPCRYPCRYMGLYAHGRRNRFAR